MLTCINLVYSIKELHVPSNQVKLVLTLHICLLSGGTMIIRKWAGASWENDHELGLGAKW